MLASVETADLLQRVEALRRYDGLFRDKMFVRLDDVRELIESLDIHKAEPVSDPSLRLSPVGRERLRQFVAILREEMDERGWTERDVALAIAGRQAAIKQLELEMLMAVGADGDERVILSEESLRELDLGFGVGDGFFARLLGELK